MKNKTHLIFHFIPVRTVWYILFFILWQFERCGIFSFSFYNCSNGVVYFVFHFITFRTCGIFCFSFDDKQNIPHRSNCHKMKHKIYHTVRSVIKWKTKYTTPFEMSSNEKQNITHVQNVLKWKKNIPHISDGVVYFVFHLMTVRTVWYILFFILWQFERCGIFCFHSITVRTVQYI
jgi:hypothetical protein